MIYLGNYKDYVTTELMYHLETHDGETVPVWQPDRWSGDTRLEKIRELARHGYSNGKHNFQQFNSKSKDMENFVLTLPPIFNNKNFVWWIIKLYPGQMQSMHFDPHLIDCKNPQRFTLFLQDFQPGHIFVWDNQIISDYKSGDLFQWSDPMCYHGCVNIGYETRYTLQITTFDN